MNTFLVLSIGLISVLDLGNSLQCSVCDSSNSWADCNEQATTRNCGTRNDACYAVRMTRYNGKVYKKSCTQKDTCNDVSICVEDTTYCKVTCCNSDSCTPDGSSAFSFTCKGWLISVLATIVIYLTTIPS